MIITNQLRKIPETIPEKTFPENIQIETNNFCNAACNFCPHRTMKRKKEEMEDVLLEKILKEIVEQKGCKTVYPFLNNEPLLEKRMRKILMYLKSNRPDIKIPIYSNCINLNSDMVNWGFDILVASIDAGTADTYYEIKGLDFNVLLSNLKDFIHLRDVEGINKSIIFNFTITSQNQHEQDLFYLKMREIMNPKIDQIRFCELANWAGKIKDKIIKYYGIINCIRLNSCHILSNGKICACCYDLEGDLIFGDVNIQTISEIWNGHQRDVFLNEFMEQKFYNLCENCNMR